MYLQPRKGNDEEEGDFKKYTKIKNIWDAKLNKSLWFFFFVLFFVFSSWFRLKDKRGKREL